jgi:hypothetical protein
MEDEGDFDSGGYDGGDDAQADGNSSRLDVEEALIRQKQDRGDPDPRRADTAHLTKGPRLRGRADAGVGGNFEGLTQYHDTAVRNGTTLQNAVRDYVQVENAWRKNPVHGVIYTAQRLGLDPRQLIAAAGQHLFGQNGDQTMAARAQGFHIDTINRDIAAFGADPRNRFFAENRQRMAQLVQHGYANDLKSAYRMSLTPTQRAIHKMERLDSQRDRQRRGTYSGYGR